jgi:4-carboxymuconolactone decarboxylase
MRLPAIEPDEMSERQREIAVRIAGRRGAVRGPFPVWLNSPELCERVEALGAFLRRESSLPPRLRELSLLMAARQVDAQYSWNAHAGTCVAEGIPRAAVEAIARRELPRFDNPEDEAFYRFCRELLEEHFVPDDTFAGAFSSCAASSRWPRWAASPGPPSSWARRARSSPGTSPTWKNNWAYGW